MRVFYHLIYEYKKGVRDFMLCTLSGNMEEKARFKLEKNKNGNINVFFGKEECLTVADKICGGRPLNLLTPEEDFILGILLGYSISEQCNRYCKKDKEKERKENILCLT